MTFLSNLPPFCFGASMCVWFSLERLQIVDETEPWKEGLVSPGRPEKDETGHLNKCFGANFLYHFECRVPSSWKGPQNRAVTVKGWASNLDGIQMPGLKNRLNLLSWCPKESWQLERILYAIYEGPVCPAMVPLLGLVALPGYQIKTRPLVTLLPQVGASQCVKMKRGCGQGHWEDMLKKRRQED